MLPRLPRGLAILLILSLLVQIVAPLPTNPVNPLLLPALTVATNHQRHRVRVYSSQIIAHQRLAWDALSQVMSRFGARSALQLLFTEAQMNYRSAHKFRHGHAVYGLLHAHTMADYKAVSRNLMHHDVTITDSIYAALLDDEVERRISTLGSNGVPLVKEDDEMERYIHQLPQDQLVRVLKMAAARLAS
jgi:hypothetical protein